MGKRRTRSSKGGKKEGSPTTPTSTAPKRQKIDGQQGSKVKELRELVRAVLTPAEVTLASQVRGKPGRGISIISGSNNETTPSSKLATHCIFCTSPKTLEKGKTEEGPPMSNWGQVEKLLYSTILTTDFLKSHLLDVDLGQSASGKEEEDLFSLQKCHVWFCPPCLSELQTLGTLLRNIDRLQARVQTLSVGLRTVLVKSMKCLKKKRDETGIGKEKGTEDEDTDQDDKDKEEETETVVTPEPERVTTRGRNINNDLYSFAQRIKRFLKGDDSDDGELELDCSFKADCSRKAPWVKESEAPAPTTTTPPTPITEVEIGSDEDDDCDKRMPVLTPEVPFPLPSRGAMVPDFDSNNKTAVTPPLHENEDEFIPLDADSINPEDVKVAQNCPRIKLTKVFPEMDMEDEEDDDDESLLNDVEDEDFMEEEEDEDEKRPQNNDPYLYTLQAEEDIPVVTLDDDDDDDEGKEEDQGHHQEEAVDAKINGRFPTEGSIPVAKKRVTFAAPTILEFEEEEEVEIPMMEDGAPVIVMEDSSDSEDTEDTADDLEVDPISLLATADIVLDANLEISACSAEDESDLFSIKHSSPTKHVVVNGHGHAKKEVVESVKPLYQCDLCGDRFLSILAKRSHMFRRHRVQSSFKCPICPRVFHQNSHLEAHYVTHLDKKPFSCPHCGVGFTRISSLQRHQTLLCCSGLDESQLERGISEAAAELRKKRSEAEKSYKRRLKVNCINCTLCRKKFLTERNLNDHYMKKHNVLVEFTVEDGEEEDGIDLNLDV